MLPKERKMSPKIKAKYQLSVTPHTHTHTHTDSLSPKTYRHMYALAQIHYSQKGTTDSFISLLFVEKILIEYYCKDGGYELHLFRIYELEHC